MDKATIGSWGRYLVHHIEETVGTVFFLVMVVSVSIGVVFRYVFNHPLIWTEEIANFAFLWGVFMGSAAAARRHQHIVVDTLMLLTPKPFQRVVGIATGSLVAAMLAAVTILPWTARNYVESNSLVPISANAGVDFYIGYIGGVAKSDLDYARCVRTGP
jgi:TRAP-type C4-dicarboxylate transport system permease small subunit